MITQAPTDADVAIFEDLIRRSSGIVLRSRRGDLQGILTRVLAASGETSIRALHTRIAADPQGVLVRQLIEAVTIGETHFFRNQPQFEALEQRILPDLIRRRSGTRTLRIWSAGCSTGEEPYSIAILLHRLLPDLAHWNVLILATDINTASLEKARAAVYGAWSFRQTPQAIQNAYFQARGEKRALSPMIRRMVTFGRVNLIEDAYPSFTSQTTQMDLILCRNVFIYFDEPTIARVAERMYQTLVDGGWMLIGHSEPSQLLFRAFKAVEFPGTVAYQKEGFAAPPPLRSSGAPLLLDPAVPAFSNDAATRSPAPYLPPNSSTPPAGAAPSAPIQPAPARAETVDLAAIELLMAARNYEPAERALNAAHAQSPRDARINYLLARIHTSRMRWDAAARHIAAALEVQSLNADFHYLHGLILQETGAHVAAVEAFRRCTFLAPGMVLAQYFMAVNLKRCGALDRAEKVVERLARALKDCDQKDVALHGDGLTLGQLQAFVANWRRS